MLKSFKLDNPTEMLCAAMTIMDRCNDVVRRITRWRTIDNKDFIQWRDETSALWKQCLDAIEEIRPYSDVVTDQYLDRARDMMSEVLDANFPSKK